jgi:multidrug efflux system outer membrane protein
MEQQARAANQDLKAAMARVAQARAAARLTRSEFYPVITLDPSAQRARSSANRTTNGQTGKSTTSNDFRVPFDLSYEIDVWGRVRRLYESSLAQAQASADDYQVVLQTLEADVAQNYFTLRSLDSQARILAKSVESYRQQLELTQTQRRAGLVGQIDVVQAQTQLNSTRVQETEVHRQRADTEHALAILLGRPPSELSVAVRPLDLAPPVIPPGLPADLLRSRPDVAEAEQNLIAANAQVAVAIAQFYPQFHLTGAAGFESADLQHVFDWQSRTLALGPSVSVPIFEGGKLDAGLQQAKARYDELVATYRGRVLAAFRDVEDALTDLHLRAEQAKNLDLAVQSAREYLRLAEVQYHGGLTNYLLVIDAQRTLLANELSAAQLLNQRLISTVLLIKSLGGAWSP